MSACSVDDIKRIANEIRGDVIKMIHASGAAHLGSSLSCVDILVACLFGAMSIDPKHPNREDRDRILLSKGHAAGSLYAALAHRGFFPVAKLKTFGQEGSCLTEHPGPGCAPGVEAATGSLGHGLSIAIGMALAGRIKKINSRTFVVLSDGELNEGSVWEALMFASAQRLSNITVIVDFNKWQATGRSKDIMAIEPIADKFKSFGWDSVEVDGHNMEELIGLLKEYPRKSSRSLAIVAHTVKGKGVSFMEDDNNWHYRVPNEAEVTAALKELGL